MTKTLQEKMFQDMAQKDVFKQAQSYAFDYADRAFDRRVFPTGAVIARLENFVERLPDGPGDGARILEQLHQLGSPATVSQIGGRYFGFVNGSVIPVSLAARWLADFWDQNTALNVMSPVVAKLEEVVEAWLREIFSLPETAVAGFVSGSSVAILCGLAAARYRVLQNNQWDINKQGLTGAPKIRIVVGRQAHGTVIKAIALLGLGTGNIEWVDTDDQGRMIVSQLPQLDDSTILILQAGNVRTGSFDPFDEICDKANKADAWVHIDGAFGLWAAGSKSLQYLTKGIEMAHSWSVDGHKTLNTPYDNGIVLCRDKEALIQALQAAGSYIAYSENRDGMLYTPEMSRRARVVELWAALKYLGKVGVDALVSGLHERAVQMSQELAAEGFQILNDVVFNQVLVAAENDEITRQTMDNVQKSGECWAGGATWNGKAVIRISVCSWATTEEDVTRSVRAFVTARNQAVQDSYGQYD
ncbi:MAG: aspartate aminotransferase family protein [Ardenticatenaceae bacterium]|nr:aspartate aminotransferase family protein [Ardenticatenaceae bacterium]MCB9444377.1 aspartate aminotransferase family protein [Ardenticatenaceae bacterium]